jgi:Dyp-type peroxidase family
MNKIPNEGSQISSDNARRFLEEKILVEGKRKQPGIAFPSAAKQEYALIIRFNLKPLVRDVSFVRNGLRNLCTFLEEIDNGIVRIDEMVEHGEIARPKLSIFNLTSTLGFGVGFFDKLQIRSGNRPNNIYEMPDYEFFGDPVPYILPQTDMILQLCSTKDFVNRWVFKNDFNPLMLNDKIRRTSNREYGIISESARFQDVTTAIRDWALITDVHSGFQRLDGRNLMGFNDGLSQPDRLKNDIIWTTKNDEVDKLTDGTYLVFQKIEHDLERWEKLSDKEQERYVGRSKKTGLFIGTLSHSEDEKLALDCRSDDLHTRNVAKSKLKKLLDLQRDPQKGLFDSKDPRLKNISLECPIWSHVRKANPRGADGAERSIIFRRGYLFMEDTIIPGDRASSGLLFVCFQRDVKHGFEHIKKHFLNNRNFPVPEKRKKFTRQELVFRRSRGRFSEEELTKLDASARQSLGLEGLSYTQTREESQDVDAENTGREGLSGPSQLGVNPRGDYPLTITLGGGYYFVPPIPKKRISDLGQQFFE